jgi:cytochrome c oxidase assembly protein subunit 15
MSTHTFTRLAVLATVLALCVVVFGAYVRLSHAGLSCPDWPGCYGQIGVPQSEEAIATANKAFPERPVNTPRAWKEMVHRYLAGVLGLLILAMAVIAWRRRKRPGQRVVLPFAIGAMVLAQALLGMWTVTLLLKPLVVTAHLLGGMTITLALWWLALRHGGLVGGFNRSPGSGSQARYGPWLLGAMALVYAQIFLGGWTSTNYAALACVDFPLCQGEVVPPLDLGSAFTLWHGLGRDYEGGILATDARVTIHFVHRLGAVFVFIYVGLLAFFLIDRGNETRLRRCGAVMLLVLLAQVMLGISNVVFSLPLPVAVMHNGVAALLLLAIATVYHVLYPPRVVV